MRTMGNGISLGSRLSEGLNKRLSARARRPRRRAAARAALALVIAAVALIVTPKQMAQVCMDAPKPGCFAASRHDIAFMIDRSGSIALRGQTYNLQLEGVARALRNPTIIPRDGTTAVAVVLFAEDATVQVPLTEINSAAEAEELAKAVEALMCQNTGSQVFPCPFGATSYVAAIQTTDNHMSQNQRTGARRTLVMSTDGDTTDNDAGAAAFIAQQRRNAAVAQGIPFELDVILMGLAPGTPEFATNKARVDQIVIPQPASDLPGATLVINSGPCNAPDAVLDSDDCDQQADQFAANVRSILRSDVAAITLVVNTAADTPPDTPISPGQGTISLRQAIERANCNGGSATITFADNIIGQTISPLVPLPAITQPDIIIDGCDGQDCAPAVTIDGAQTDTDQGEQHDDGILIRSNRTTVRGLRIINFDRAGIAVDPACLQDLTGFNLIEQNVLEDNNSAGVLVREREDAQGVRTNIGNTISRNAISGSATLIDLGADGSTPNDTGDPDQGPNTLLNFPDSLNATLTTDQNTSVITLTGQANGPMVAGATVEIFAVTAFRIVQDQIVIDAVTFLTEATVAANGAFTATSATPSPTGIYTATITDAEGNTSELMSQSAATNIARPVAAVATPVNFGQVQVNTPSQAQQVVLTNTGTAPLTVSSFSVVQCDPQDRDDSARFAVTTSATTPITINPGQQATFNVVFTPNACGAARACLVLVSNNPAPQQVPIELNGTGGGQAQAQVTLEGNASALEFGPVTVRAKPKKLRNRPLRTFTIANTGCAPLNLTLASINRIGSDVASGRITDTDDSAFFNVSMVVGNNETPVTSSVTIPEGGQATFRVRFNPVIPAVANQTSGLSAEEVLPEEVTSRLTFNQNGGNPITIDLIGMVEPELKLINPDNPRRAPLVSLVRSGGELVVEFSVWDADMDVSRATYQFLDRAGRAIGPSFDVDLTSAIQQSDLVEGQSFTVVQRFIGTDNLSNVASVRVTVFDGETSQTATSGNVVSAGGLVSSQAARRATTLSLPAVIKEKD